MPSTPRLILLLFSMLATLAGARAQPPAPPQFPEPARTPEVIGDRPTYPCRRASSPVRIDGVLDETGWKQAPPTRPFRLSHGKGSPAAKTRVRALWDDRALYLAFECEDRVISSPYTRRDEPLYEAEVVEVFLATGGDPRRYIELEVSPANVLFDARVVNMRPGGKMTVDKAWNAPGLRSAVRGPRQRSGSKPVAVRPNRRGERDTGWTVEIALPFADLDLPRAVRPGDTWRVNFYRIEREPREEFSAWSPTLADPPDFHIPDRFGRLVFL
jgi:hypothetical protein